MIKGMDENQNPYEAPAPDFNAELPMIRRRRKLLNIAMIVGLTVVLFVAYWGVRVLFFLLNNWLARGR